MTHARYLGILAQGVKRLMRVVFRRPRPVNHLSRHLAPAEQEAFAAEMAQRGMQTSDEDSSAQTPGLTS